MAPRLKTLELHGYKTFASRSAFEFPANITAVVGPNGSGKSNIADSIRWVLGEQSFSLLRGRKTEDMIFAGSEQRSKAGMATATIIFDNEDGWLPIDFSEVSIARRAYRDGQNEYLLNGQKVRLKEISELLAQSGLAQRTYTIIGQGLVDAALSAKPDERRRFFEEAAGIGLYRSRREEAINRLDTTRRNLERVLDIIAELEPRLQSLEKQARRAQEYRRVQADLQVLLRDWYGFHWHKTQQELAHTRSVLQAQEGLLEQTRGRAGESDLKIDQIRGTIQTLRDQLNTWHVESAEIHNRWEKANRSLAVLDERSRALKDQEQALQTEVARLEEESRARQERVSALEVEQKHTLEELSDARVQAEKAHQELHARQVEREKAERSLRETRRQLVNFETQKVQRGAHLNELNTRIEAFQATRKTLEETLSSESAALKKLQDQLTQAEHQREKTKEELDLLEDEYQEKRSEQQKMEAALRQQQTDIAGLEAQQTRLLAQIEVLDQAEKSFSGLNQGAKFILESARQGALPGNYQSLSSKLEVPPEIETAVAAVLGEFLDGVLLSDNTDPEQALELIARSEKGKGRAVLFPLSKLGEVELLAKPQGEDVIGIAADLVRGPKEMQPLVRLLLGQVIVVKSRQAAQRVAGTIPTAARVVTLQGEVYSGSGIVIAGQDGRSGVIARPRQKKELLSTLEEVESEHKKAFSAYQRSQSALEDHRSQMQALEREVKEANQKLTQSNQAYQQANLAVGQARQKSEFQRSQISSTEAQIVRAEEEMKQTQAQIGELTEQIASFEEQVRNLNRALSGLPLEEMQSQMAHWNTNSAVAERSVKEAQSRLEEARQGLTNHQRQIQSAHQRLENISGSFQVSETEKAALRDEENQLDSLLGALRAKIDPSETDLQRYEENLNQLQGDQTAAHQALTVAERHVSQAQIEVTRQRETLDSLRRRIEDDFGLVAFEYKSDISGPTPLPFEGMVAQLPVIKEIPTELEDNINRHRAQLRRMGAVNLEAQVEYDSVQERFIFLTTQVDDLKAADEDLRKVIGELDELMKKEFFKTFNAVATEFRQVFTRLFGGGAARLTMTNEENINDSGVEIEVRLPGRREQGLSLLSGGERSLTAVALIFSLLKVSPTPFCVLDEVDAALDEANVGRFCDLLLELSQNTQFIVITHNRNTVQISEVIYGITMGRDSASQVISLRLDEVGGDMIR